ncbi:Signal transduction histidine kinase [Blastococcus aggregatus]|uniref:histidine kinase n=1 Tax=Blastococcus aggregatus TaxID=38502 RepID=A0A285V768_9ACTN|nr:HAMP domain-containing sensor histidine kinase [Blastococcus aggregatus]SOC49975.1 Signal transduction histidine kinase [Blastococcus aggregatus]
MTWLGWLRPSGRTSLRSRLAWSASLVVALWVVLLAVGANILLARGLAAQADDVLRARAEATALTVEVAVDGKVSVLETRDDRALDVGTWIFTGDGSIVERPPGSSPALDAEAAGLSRACAGTRDLEAGESLRLLCLPVIENGQQVAAVVTSSSMSPYDQVQRLALLGSVGVAVVLMVIVHVVLRANVTRALRPVQQMSVQAGRWSAEDVERRFGSEPRPAELAELAETLDQLLDRLAAVIRHEQRFSEELSHELRTPLARIQAEVDLLIAQPRDATALQTAHLAIDRSTRSMRSILDTMMTAARSMNSLDDARSRLDEILVRLTELDRLGDGTPVVVDCPAGLIVGVDGDVLERALAPVVDNAIRYARTQVTIHGSREQGRIAVTVIDDGPGMTEEIAERAFEPGFRGDAGDGHPGAGLGLALVRRLVVAAGGTAQATASASGGQVRLTFPPG